MAPVAARRAPPQAAPPNQPYLLVRFLLIVLRDFVFFADAFGWTRSGRTFLPVERFHSSYWSSVILPSTSSCANFRRCALLLKGIQAEASKREIPASAHLCSSWGVSCVVAGDPAGEAGQVGKEQTLGDADQVELPADLTACFRRQLQ